MTMSATVNKDEDKTIRHTTTIEFSSKDEMLEALAHYNVDPSDESTTTTYYDGSDDEIISYSQMAILKKHGLPYWEETKSVRSMTYEGDCRVQEKFGCRFTPSCGSYTITIQTYDLTARQHKAEVRKILRPIRLAGYKVRYKCESEITNKRC